MWINVFFMYWLSYRIRWLSIADEVALSERNTHRDAGFYKSIYKTDLLEAFVLCILSIRRIEALVNREIKAITAHSFL